MEEIRQELVESQMEEMRQLPVEWHMEMIRKELEDIRQELVEAGVIERVLDAFNPQIIISPFYGDKPISSGDEVLIGDLVISPHYLGFGFDPDGPGLRESFSNPRFIMLIMTDPHSRGGEYLHWMVAGCVSIGHYKAVWQTVVPYEPPRSIATRMLLFTLFKPNAPLNLLPNSRWNFSTRGFAEANALGPPLGAALLKIKYENTRNEDTHGDDTETAGRKKTRIKRPVSHETTSKRKRVKRT